MTIQEAIRSGKAFRRPGGEWFNALHESSYMCLKEEALLANDWEIKEENIPFNSSIFWKAYKDAFVDFNTVKVIRSPDGLSHREFHEFIGFLITHLGVNRNV